MKWQKLYIVFFIPALFTACLKSPEMTTGFVNGKEKPTVITAPTARVTPIPSDGALVFQGEISSTGKGGIIERGFYWSSTSNDPGVNDNIIQSTATTDTFKYLLQNVSGEKTYYWRAYARNSFGYDYGEVDSCRTPDIWIKIKNSLPSESRGRGVTFILNDTIYITCGVKNAAQVIFVNTMWEYSIASDGWNQADSLSFPGAERRDPVVFTIDNYAFVGTGQGLTQAYKDFYQFNSNSKKWMVVATPNDFQARYESNAFSLKGKGYVISGFNGGVLNDVWQYDAGNNLWKRMGDFPANFYGGISISDNNRSFAGFGQTPESARILWEYDPVSDRWTDFTHLPDSITTKIYSGAIIGNAIYIVDVNNKIWALNMSDKAWTQKSSLPLDFLSQSGEFLNQPLLTDGASNSIYVGLGFSGYLYEYHPLWDN